MNFEEKFKTMKKVFIITSLSLAIIFNIGCSKENEENPTKTEFAESVLIGNWSGPVKQVGDPINLNLSITSLKASEVAGRAKRSCTRDLTYLRRSGNQFFFNEEVPSDLSQPEYCNGKSTSVITIVSENTVTYSWSSNENTLNTASGTLTKR
jgi:hypothetical protein